MTKTFAVYRRCSMNTYESIVTQVERGIGYAGIIAYSVLVFVAVVRLTIGA